MGIYWATEESFRDARARQTFKSIADNSGMHVDVVRVAAGLSNQGFWSADLWVSTLNGLR